jgi:hypothetical protein
MPPATDDAAVLSKLDAAELRIGMCEDAKLAKLLDPALCNILGFLSSASPAVRQKVMAILSHLNKRLKADGSIVLPLGGLIKLFTSPSSAPFVANFALVYIDMGFPRVSSADRSSLLPSLLVGIARRPAAQQDSLLALLLAALPTLPLPKTKAELPVAPTPPPSTTIATPNAPTSTDPNTAAAAAPTAPAAASRPTLPFLTDAADRSLILSWLLDLLLYMPPLASDPHTPPPGLSRAAAKRVCGKLDAAEVCCRSPEAAAEPPTVNTSSLAHRPRPSPSPISLAPRPHPSPSPIALNLSA